MKSLGVYYPYVTCHGAGVWSMDFMLKIVHVAHSVACSGYSLIRDGR